MSGGVSFVGRCLQVRRLRGTKAFLKCRFARGWLSDRKGPTYGGHVINWGQIPIVFCINWGQIPIVLKRLLQCLGGQAQSVRWLLLGQNESLGAVLF